MQKNGAYINWKQLSVECRIKYIKKKFYFFHYSLLCLQTQLKLIWLMFFHNNLIHNFWSCFFFIYFSANTFRLALMVRAMLFIKGWGTISTQKNITENVFFSHSTSSFQCDPYQTEFFWINCVELCLLWPVNDLHLMKNITKYIINGMWNIN